jgi:protein TonB
MARTGRPKVYSLDAAPDVYSVDEIARAAYVDRAAVDALVRRGRLRLIPSTRFASAPDALAAARALRHGALLASAPVEAALFAGAPPAPRRGGPSRAWSLALHMGAIAAVLTMGHQPARSAPTAPPQGSRLVFLADPGPGGGGGGGGTRSLRPASALLRHTALPAPVPSQPEPARQPEPTPEPEVLPSRQLFAPVALVANASIDRPGVPDAALASAQSRGPGVDDGSGAGERGGDGNGRGVGLGDGENLGTGGGVYRAGSGVEPPRLLHEVKATYTDEARRASVTGDVVMDVVIRADGSVASARIVRGLGFGLDERAAAAVRQWRFAPARRAGQPVNVAVEVAVQFNLR